MEKRIILAKASQNGPMGRGQSGKKKIYEIVVVNNVVTFSWGMAEKAQRQTKRKVCVNVNHAVQVANEKKWEKRMGGYELVLEA